MKKLLMMVAFLGCAFGAMTLASCGDDDDNSGNNGGGEVVVSDKTPAYWEAEIGFYAGDTITYADTKEVLEVTATYPETFGSAKRLTSENLELRTVDKRSYVTIRSDKFGGLDSVKINIKIKDSYVYRKSAGFYAGYTYRAFLYNKKGQALEEGKIIFELGNGSKGIREDKWDAYVTRFLNGDFGGEHTYYIETTANKTISITRK